jgi:hypothetical protein
MPFALQPLRRAELSDPTMQSALKIGLAINSIEHRL